MNWYHTETSDDETPAGVEGVNWYQPGTLDYETPPKREPVPLGRALLIFGLILVVAPLVMMALMGLLAMVFV